MFTRQNIKNGFIAKQTSSYYLQVYAHTSSPVSGRPLLIALQLLGPAARQEVH
jgi:hypothetical protein